MAIKATLEDVVFQGLGAASMCWSEIPTGVFDSERAKQIGQDIMAAIYAAIEQARLGQI